MLSSEGLPPIGDVARPGDIFACQPQGEGQLLPSSGCRTGTLLNSLQCTVLSSKKEILSIHGVINAVVENT